MGMTIKEFNRAAFWRALKGYEKSTLETLAVYSIALHISMGFDGVNRNMRRMARRVIKSKTI